MWALLFIIACGTDKDVADSDSEPAPEPFEWAAGEFQFETVSVRDACLGGALEVLFMPDGPEDPHKFEYPIFLPSYEELPSSYTVDLREPFVEMPVTVDSDDGETLQIRGSVMEAVELGIAYGDCVVTMTVDLDLTPSSANTAEGDAVITITDPRGEEALCPVFDDSPCAVDLNLIAVRF